MALGWSVFSLTALSALRRAVVPFEALALRIEELQDFARLSQNLIQGTTSRRWLLQQESGGLSLADVDSSGFQGLLADMLRVSLAEKRDVSLTSSSPNPSMPRTLT